MLEKHVVRALICSLTSMVLPVHSFRMWHPLQGPETRSRFRDKSTGASDSLGVRKRGARILRDTSSLSSKEQVNKSFGTWPGSRLPVAEIPV